MKKVGKIVCGVLVTIFVIIAIFVTINMLAFNDYEVAEFGNKSLIIANKHMEKYGYLNGDLIIATKKNNDSIKKGDSVLYYNNYESKTTIDEGRVQEVSSNGSQLYLDSEMSVSKNNVIGKSDDVKIVSTVGKVLNVLETRLGYLFIILLPTIALFAYLIRKVTVELKEDKKN